MTFGLSAKTTEQVRAILRRCPQVEAAIVYGSRAKGTQARGSDIDLALVGAVTHDALLKIAGELDDSLIPHRVDLAIWNNITDSALRDHIQRRGQVFYRREVG